MQLNVSLPEARPSTEPQLSSSSSSGINGYGGKSSTLFKRHLCGDIFGSSILNADTSLAGMIFKSKMSPGGRSKRNSSGEEPDRRKDKVENQKSISHDIKQAVLEVENESLDKMSHSLNPRQQLAMTIRNWANIPENDVNLISEGAIDALIQLSSIEDYKIKKSCAAAFHALSSRAINRPALVNKSVTNG